MGGVISDLESRVKILENNRLPRPNFSKWLWQDYRSGENIIPGYDGDTIVRTDDIIVPYDGWMFVEMHGETFDGASGEMRNTLIQFIYNNQRLNFVDITPSKYNKGEQLQFEQTNNVIFPCFAGDKYFLGGNYTHYLPESWANSYPNNSGNTVKVIIYSYRD